MLELDLILLPFAETAFVNLDSSAKTAYLRLLEQEDQDLYRWLLGSESPADEGLQAIITQILEFNAAKKS